MVSKMAVQSPGFLAVGAGLIFLSVLLFTHHLFGQETPQGTLARVCGQCHATVINDQCVAGDCQTKPIIHSNDRDWKIILDYMIDSLGCKMTSAEQKTITEFLERRYPGKSSPFHWIETYTTPRGLGWNIVALTGWQEHLYFGTEGGGRIFRSEDGISWNEVADTGHDKVYGITAYQGSLYAGTYNPQPQIWRSADGLHWSRVATLPTDQRGIT